jgi:hypothetical protein
MESDNICVFGLGKLFWDNFFNHKWNKVLGQTCFCDNSEDLWGKTIDGIKCISPEELSRLDNVLVITHVSADKEIREQLKNYGIKKIVNIRELYQRF